VSTRQPVPTEIRRLAAEGRMQISWSDGHQSTYPLAYLRGWCPCAMCQGHGGDRRYVHAENVELKNIAVVGKYALSLSWGDGHDTGIYSYRYLRELCPCCVPASAGSTEEQQP
jgi:DUF971 family protein